MKRPRSLIDAVSLKIAGRYLVLGALWIVISNILAHIGIQIQPYADILFTLVMGGIVYLLVTRSLHAVNQVRDVEMNAQQNFQDLIHALPEFVCVRDEEGHWLEANPFALELFGLEDVRYHGKTFREFHSLCTRNTHVLEEWGGSMWKVWTPGEPQMHEFAVTLCDGETRIYSFLDAPMFNPDGRPKAVLTVGRDITNYKQAEQRIMEKEQQYKSLVDHNSDAILAFDLAGKCLDVNPMAPNLTGYSKEELLHMPIVDILQVENPKNFMAMLNHEVGLHGVSPEVELQLVRRDGVIKNVHINAVPIYLRGSVVGYFAIVRDVTEQKRAQDELRAAKELLESFVNHTTDAIHVLDLSGRVLLINDAFEEVFGWSSDEVVGQILPGVPADLQDELKRQQEWVQKGENVSGIETRRIRKDGTRIYISLTVSPIRDDAGRVVAYAGISRDVTESKRVEKALRESEAKYRLIAEHTNALIAVIDSDGYFTYASPSHLHVVGHDPSVLEGSHTTHYVHPDDLQRVSQSFSDSLKTGNPFQIDFRYPHNNGDWVYLETQGAPVVGGDGTLEKVVVVSQDVTDRKQTEELLRQSDRLAVIGQLAAGVAHEIRNPLTALKGFVQLLQNQSNSNTRYLDIMTSELSRIEAIVNEFLLIAKPQVVNYRETDVIPLLDSTITLLETQAIMNNVQIHTEYESRMPRIHCEQNQLKQVFINILKNSIEAMPHGGDISICVRMYDKDTIHFRFMDDGVGIPPERIAHLGAPFYTTKEKGTGLGLTVSYKIIREHRGRIEVASDVGHGTIVDIMLPVDGDASVDSAQGNTSIMDIFPQMSL